MNQANGPVMVDGGWLFSLWKKNVECRVQVVEATIVEVIEFLDSQK